MINEVENAFGRPFLSYVLAADQLDIEFSTPQQEVLDVLQQFVDAANEHEEPFRRLNILEHAARFRPDFGMSQANALRVYCGGELPDVDDASALITSLLTAARDVYPLFLIPTPEGMPITGPTGAYSHPESEEFSRHALRDESLSRLFPGAPSALGTTRRDLDSVHSDILWSDGQGGGLQLNSVLPALLEAAYRLYVLNKKDTATEYLQYTKLILQQAQALARGDTVEVPYIIGLSNISLGSDGQLNLAFGRITPPDPSALRLITRGTQSIEQRISAVLHASFPLRLFDIKPWDPTQSNHTEEEESSCRDFPSIEEQQTVGST